MAGTWPRSSCRGRPLSALRTADHPFCGEALKGGGCRDAQQASDWNSTLGDDNFFASSGSFQPLAQVCSEVTYSDIHDLIVQSDRVVMY